MRVVLAEDHLVVRDGLRMLLAAEKDIAVIGEAADGREVLDLIARLTPDVLLLDLMLPGLNGIEVLRQVVKRFPRTRVVLLSMQSSEQIVIEALRSGAWGFVPKEAASAEVTRAVREVMAGRRYLAPPLSERAIAAYTERAVAMPPDPYEALSGREREVLQLAAEGHSNPEIARRLFVSPRTVETHRQSIGRKIGLKSQAEIIRYAIRRGIVAP